MKVLHWCISRGRIMRALLCLQPAAWCAAMFFSATPGTAATLADFGHGNMKVNGKAALGVRPAVIILLDLANTGTFSHPSSYYSDYVFNPNNATTAGVRSVNGYLLANSHGRFSIAPAGVGIVGPVQLSASDRMAALGNDVMRAGLAINAAALAGFNFAPFDSNGNGQITTDELLILIFDNSSTADSGAARSANPTGLNPNNTLSAFTPPGSSVSMLMNVVILTQSVSFATLCHELCHLLGAKDLYGIWNQTCHGGNYTLMSCTITNPDDLFTYHLDAWHKMQLGWVEPRIR
jgi:M6 family metalloprotease-like protein